MGKYAQIMPLPPKLTQNSTALQFTDHYDPVSVLKGQAI